MQDGALEGAAPMRLSAAIGATPRTRALLAGEVTSPALQLDFAALPTINRAFAPMVRALRYDVSEMAIATFLQAKACGKPLVLLPVVLAARFQQAALLCRDGSGIAGPADLRGRRVGVRAYSQTTGLWLRGILAEDYGLQPDEVRWVTFEDAHVSEIRDPPWAERAAPGADLLTMLRDGEVDAVIVGNDVPDDPGLRTVFPDPAAAADAFWARHRLVPVNHMLTMRRDLAERRPDVVMELLRMVREAARGVPAAARDAYPFGRAAVQPAVALALRYATEQDMLPRPLGLDEVWDGLPAGLE